MGKKSKQLGFKILQDSAWKKGFGGTRLRSHAKVARPISFKRPVHLVLHSQMAKGQFSLLRFTNLIQKILDRQASRFGIKIYRYANSGNHLHLVVKPHSRQSYNSFIRSISGLIPRLVLSAEKGMGKGLKFWAGRPFSRIVEWGRDYKGICAYLLQNKLEALGFAEYQTHGRNAVNSS